MGSSNSTPTPHSASERPAVTTDKQRICVAGINYSPYCGRARKLASLIAERFPENFETWFYFDSSSCFDDFTAKTFGSSEVVFPSDVKGQSTAPFIWIESRDSVEYVGTSDQFRTWAKNHPTLKLNTEVLDAANVEWAYSDLLHHQCCIQATSQIKDVKANVGSKVESVKDKVKETVKN